MTSNQILAVAVGGGMLCSAFPVSEAGEKIDLAKVKNGIVCFTFDDGCYQDWLPQLALFDRFNAKATFFYMNKLDAPALESMRELAKHGHTIGLHTISHRSAVDGIAQDGAEAYIASEITPQLEAAKDTGVKIDCLAYPNNLRSEETDRALSGLFRHFRAGLPVKHAKGYWIADQDDVYIDLDRIAATPVLGGCGIGEYYLSTQENIDAGLERAAKENKLIVFFSHGMSNTPRGIDISISMLERCLNTASRLGMAIAGFDDLP